MKYMMTPIGGGELMFDLGEDPKEQHNLIDCPRYADVVEQMRNKCKEYIQKHSPQLMENGELKQTEAIRNNRDVGRWPGFHSTLVPTDVLH